MRTIELTSRLADEEADALAGTLLGPDSYDLLISDDADVFKPDGSPLLSFRRKVLPLGVCRRAFPALVRAARPTANRGTAAGIVPADHQPEDRAKGARIIREGRGTRFRSQKADGTLSNTTAAKVVESGVIGYFDRSARFPYCRMTNYTMEDASRWETVLPLIQAVDAVFAFVHPERYAAQLSMIAQTHPDFVIGGTAFTTVTVNRNWQTAVHKDVGDLPEGFGVMTAMQQGAYDGCYLCFPAFRTAVNMRTGDVCMADVHEWHGNTPFIGQPGAYERISCVFYYRERMHDCGSAAEEAERVKSRKAGDALFSSAVQDRKKGKAPATPPLDVSSVTQKVAPPPKPALPDPAKTERDRLLADLLEFAGLELRSGDLEPWAAVIGCLAREGTLDREQALWLLWLYNAYDDLRSAWSAYSLWPSPRVWDCDTPANQGIAAGFPIQMERRNLHGGRILKRFQSYCAHLFGCSQADWLAFAYSTDSPEDNWNRMLKHVQQVWGVGRLAAFEWVEFIHKIDPEGRASMRAPDGCLWESSGPRKSLQSIYGNPSPDRQWLQDTAEECRNWLADNGVSLPWEDFETVICDFNVMRDGRYYVGRHLAALRAEVDGIPELTRAYQVTVPEPWRSAVKPGIDKSLMAVYARTGRIVTP